MIVFPRSVYNKCIHRYSNLSDFRSFILKLNMSVYIYTVFFKHPYIFKIVYYSFKIYIPNVKYNCIKYQ